MTAFPDMVVGPAYEPTNIHLATPKLPADVRRVAMLPLNVDTTNPDAVAVQETLGSILSQELSRAARFQVIQITARQLEQLTGRSTWNAEDKLPPNLFAALRAETGCDAVLFSRLTQFQPYPPLVIGWSLQLVSAGVESQILWTVDEVFDASRADVVNGARRFQQAQPQASPALADSRSIMNSPRRFGHYTMSLVLATLPSR
jgi:hypothetical protein